MLVGHNLWVVVFGNPRLAVVLDRDANMADAKGGADPLDDHGLVDMQDFVSVTAWVAALETTLQYCQHQPHKHEHTL